MQTPTRMDKVVIEDYYHMTVLNKNANWMELSHLLSILSLNPRAPSYTYTYSSTLLNVHIREK